MTSTIQGLYKSKLFLGVELLFLIGLPLALIYFYSPIIHERLKVLAAGLIYIYLVAKILKIDFQKFGFTSHNLFPSLKAIFPTIISVIAFILLIRIIQPQLLVNSILREEIGNGALYIPVLIYVFISAPVQEIIFRSFLISRLEFVSNNKLFLIVTTTLIFGSIHIPLNISILTIGSYLLGIIWADHFLKFRNYYTVWLSHAIIGSAFLLIGSTV